MKTNLVPGHQMEVLVGEQFLKDVRQVIVIDEIGFGLVCEEIRRI